MLTVLYEVGGVEERDRRDPSGAPAAVSRTSAARLAALGPMDRCQLVPLSSSRIARTAPLRSLSMDLEASVGAAAR